MCDVRPCSRQTRDRDAVRRAGNIVQTDVVAELDGRRIAAVLAADTEVHGRTGRFTHLDRHIHQFAYADRVEAGERVGFVDLVLVVRGQEFAGVVARESEGHLRQVVRAEAEELRFLRHLVGGERRARDFDHRADFVLQIALRFRDEFIRNFDDDLLDERELFDFARQRDHNLGNDVPIGVLFLDVDRRFDDRGGLHARDFGIGDRQAATAVTHHRVELVQVGDDLLDLRDRLLLCLRQSLDVLFRGGNELMQRRVEEADGYGITAQRFVQLFKVALLHRLDLRQSRFALFDGVGADHLAERRDAVSFEEHMLGAAKADALRAERGGLLRIRGGIRVGADGHRLVFVGQLHDAAEVAGRGIRSNRRDALAVDVAGRAVEGDDVALFIDFAREGELLVLLVHFDVAAAGDAAGAHAARDDRRVGGHTAAHRQDALRIVHALDVLGGGFQSYQDDLFALLALLDGIFGREHDLTGSGAGGRGQSLADGGRLLQSGGVELRVQERVERLRVDLHERLLFGDHTLVDEVARDLDRRGSRALAVAGLEHVEVLVLDRELHVLHVFIVIFQSVADLLELLVHFGHDLFHLVDGHRGADTGNDVLALRVHEELAHELLFARCRVARERNARTGGVAHVAERHHLHVDSGAPAVRDVVLHTIVVGAGVVPRTEDRLDGAEQLFLRVGREFRADLRLIFRLELTGELFEILRRQLDVLRDALLFLHRVDELLEIFFADFHNDVRIHLDEAAIAVPRPAGIARFFGENFYDFFVQTEVEDGVHHARHGSARARTDGNEQRVLLVAELFAADLFHLGDVFHDLRLDFGVDLAPVFIILRARFGGDGEALRNRQAHACHFRKVCTLAAEEFAHLCIAFREKVAIFFCHKKCFLLIRLEFFLPC